MRKANELIGKPIVQQSTGERLATVHNVVVDRTAQRAVALLIQSGGWLRDARVVPWNRITSIGDVILVHGDAPVIVTATEAQLADEVADTGQITGTRIVTASGEALGTVGDVFIDDAGNVRGYEVKHGLLSVAGRQFLAVAQVQTMGQDAVIATTAELPSVTEVERGADDAARADR